MLQCPIYNREADSALQCLDRLRKKVSLEDFAISRCRINVPGVERNLVSDTWTADGEGALPELGPCPRDNSRVGCRGTELATFELFSVKFNNVVKICRTALIVNGVHHGGDLELNSCLHRQPVKTL